MGKELKRGIRNNNDVSLALYYRIKPKGIEKPCELSIETTNDKERSIGILLKAPDNGAMYKTAVESVDGKEYIAQISRNLFFYRMILMNNYFNLYSNVGEIVDDATIELKIGNFRYKANNETAIKNSREKEVFNRRINLINSDVLGVDFYRYASSNDIVAENKGIEGGRMTKSDKKFALQLNPDKSMLVELYTFLELFDFPNIVVEKVVKNNKTRLVLYRKIDGVVDRSHEVNLIQDDISFMNDGEFTLFFTMYAFASTLTDSETIRVLFINMQLFESLLNVGKLKEKYSSINSNTKGNSQFNIIADIVNKSSGIDITKGTLSMTTFLDGLIGVILSHKNTILHLLNIPDSYKGLYREREKLQFGVNDSLDGDIEETMYGQGLSNEVIRKLNVYTLPDLQLTDSNSKNKFMLDDLLNK